jgi:hypothetical protein
MTSEDRVDCTMTSAGFEIAPGGVVYTNRWIAAAAIKLRS